MEEVAIIVVSFSSFQIYDFIDSNSYTLKKKYGLFNQIIYTKLRGFLPMQAQLHLPPVLHHSHYLFFTKICCSIVFT